MSKFNQKRNSVQLVKVEVDFNSEFGYSLEKIKR